LLRHADQSFCTLSLHDALPIFVCRADWPLGVLLVCNGAVLIGAGRGVRLLKRALVPKKEEGAYAPRSSASSEEHVRDSFAESVRDRKSTRLNSSHVSISYAVFC